MRMIFSKFQKSVLLSFSDYSFSVVSIVISVLICDFKSVMFVYVNRPTKCTNSYNVSLFIIKFSTCFEAVYRSWYLPVPYVPAVVWL